MDPAQSGAAAIEIDQLTKRFGTFVAVDQLSFTVPAGSIYGFLGPNGAGKTTTIGMVLGLIPPDSGTARIFGIDVRRNLTAALMRTGALVERPAFYPYLSGRKNLELFAQAAGIDDAAVIDRVLNAVDLIERANARFGGYSQGMRQRLGIATALAPDPSLLILDEPTNGLDPAGQREIRNLIHQLASQGRTVMLSSHLLHEIQEICTHVAIIDRGKLVSAGPMAELLRVTDQLQVEVDRPAEALELLRALPEVQAVSQRDGNLMVEAPREHAARINQALVQAGFAVSELRRQESQLEERFLALTEHEREES